MAYERRTKERNLPSIGGCSMDQDKPVQAVRRVGARDKSESTKRKAPKRRKDLKTSSWYQRAASSIKAAPGRA